MAIEDKNSGYYQDEAKKLPQGMLRGAFSEALQEPEEKSIGLEAETAPGFANLSQEQLKALMFNPEVAADLFPGLGPFGQRHEMQAEEKNKREWSVLIQQLLIQRRLDDALKNIGDIIKDAGDKSRKLMGKARELFDYADKCDHRIHQNNVDLEGGLELKKTFDLKKRIFVGENFSAGVEWINRHNHENKPGNSKIFDAKNSTPKDQVEVYNAISQATDEISLENKDLEERSKVARKTGQEITNVVNNAQPAIKTMEEQLKEINENKNLSPEQQAEKAEGVLAASKNSRPLNDLWKAYGDAGDFDAAEIVKQVIRQQRETSTKKPLENNNTTNDFDNLISATAAAPALK